MFDFTGISLGAELGFTFVISKAFVWGLAATYDYNMLSFDQKIYTDLDKNFAFSSIEFEAFLGFKL